MGVVAEMADRVVVMKHGRVVERNDAAALFAAPREAYTRALLQAVPSIRVGGPAPAPAAGRPGLAGASRRSCRIAMRPYPEPMDAARDRQAKSSVVETNTDAVELAVADRLEVQRGMVWISFELGKVAAIKRLNLERQSFEALPEAL